MLLCSYKCGVYWAWLPSNAVRHTMCTLVHVVVTQVGILQFSNDVRVELPPQFVDHQVYQKTLQTMVSSSGQFVLQPCVHPIVDSVSVITLQHGVAT